MVGRARQGRGEEWRGGEVRPTPVAASTALPYRQAARCATAGHSGSRTINPEEVDSLRLLVVVCWCLLVSVGDGSCV